MPRHTTARRSLTVVLFASLAASQPCVAFSPEDRPEAEALTDAQTAAWAVLERAAEARGGSEKIAKLTSVEFTGEFRIPGAGILASLRRVEAPGNRFLMRCETQGRGNFVQVTDGDTAWMIAPGSDEAMRLERNDRHDVLREGNFFILADAHAYYKSAEVSGTEQIDGHACTRLDLVAFNGDRTIGYFDNETGHLRRLLGHPSVTQEGVWDVHIDFTDWQEHGGLTIPMRIDQSRKGTAYQLIYDSVEFNVELDGHEFGDPSEI